MTPDNIPDILKRGRRFLLVSHVNPDGDAVGSLLGMYNALREMGKQAWAHTESHVPEHYLFLPGSSDILQDTKDIPSVDFIISLDVAEHNRISGDLSRFHSAELINIDHHGTNPLFGRYNHVDSTATSTAELVHEILKASGYTISRNVGMCLYAGLYTDTGGFRFAGVNSRTMRIASEMLAPGIDSYEVTRPLYEEFPFARLKLEALMLERLETHLNGKLLISVIRETDLRSLNASMSDTEHLVNKLRETKGVQVGVLITEMDSITRVSFRSKDVDVSKVAQALGGGGHIHAAGLKTSLPLADLHSRIISLVRTGLP